MYSVEQLMIPIWDTEVIYDEALTMVRSNGVAEAPLLFTPLEVLKVTSADKTKEYEQGVDYEVEGNVFRLTENSRIPVYTNEELIFDEKPEGKDSYSTADGKWALSEYFHSKQIAVTYTKAKTPCDFVVPYCGHLLPRTMEKLKNKEPLKIVTYGDSITVGGNCSGELLLTPFLPCWGTLLTLSLRQHYQTRVNTINTAEGGMDSIWGVAHVADRVGKHQPDLAIIAFGMNDRQDADRFVDNIQRMQEIILQHSPNTEFILCATMLQNPIIKLPGWHEHLEEYREKLLELEETGTAIADFNRMQKYIMKGKRYIDTTGNNVNHANDFLERCHAQVLADMLINRNV